MNQTKTFLVTLTLVILGTAKVVADVFGIEKLSALAAVTNTSPAMKVFTAHQGYETFSSKFHVTIRFHDGRQRAFWLTPEIYRQLDGPYNRRNVFGAALAYGPILVADARTRPMWESVMRRGFCDSHRILEELAVIDSPDQRASHMRIDYVPRKSGVNAGFASTLEYHCD